MPVRGYFKAPGPDIASCETGVSFVKDMILAVALTGDGPADLPAAERVSESKCRLLPKPPALPLDFQCVAIDDTCDPSQAIGIGLRYGDERNQKAGKKKSHEADLYL